MKERFEPKLCIHCKHHNGGGWCMRTYWRDDYMHPFTGLMVKREHNSIRVAEARDTGECGKEGRFYEDRFRRKVWNRILGR
jgi:hypothetical protein